MTEKQIDDGGQAFPCNFFEGMSFRDYVAVQALQGILASEECQETGGRHDVDWGERKAWIERNSKMAYALADAMIEARK